MGSTTQVPSCCADALSSPAWYPDRRRHRPRSSPRVLRRLSPISEPTSHSGNDAGKSQRDRPVSDRLPSETIADYVNSAVGHPTSEISVSVGLRGGPGRSPTFADYQRLSLKVRAIRGL